MSFSNISVSSVLIPAIIALLVYNKAPRNLRPFLWYIFISVVSELNSFFLRHFFKNNMVNFHLYTNFEFVILSIFFINTINKSIFKKIVVILAVLFPLGYLIHNIISNLFLKFNPLFLTLETFVLAIYGLYYFYNRIINEAPDTDLIKDPIFWIHSGMLLYFLGNTFLFMIYSYSANLQLGWHASIWHIHSVLNMSSYLIYSYGLLLYKPWKTSLR